MLDENDINACNTAVAKLIQTYTGKKPNTVFAPSMYSMTFCCTGIKASGGDLTGKKLAQDLYKILNKFGETDKPKYRVKTMGDEESVLFHVETITLNDPGFSDEGIGAVCTCTTCDESTIYSVLISYQPE